MALGWRPQMQKSAWYYYHTQRDYRSFLSAQRNEIDHPARRRKRLVQVSVLRARCGKHCRLWNMCLVYLLACQVRVNYRPLRSLLLCFCDVFRALMNSLVRWFWNMRFCVSLQWIWRYLWFSKLCFDLVFVKYKQSLTPPDRTNLSQLFLMGRK